MDDIGELNMNKKAYLELKNKINSALQNLNNARTYINNAKNEYIDAYTGYGSQKHLKEMEEMIAQIENTINVFEKEMLPEINKKIYSIEENITRLNKLM